MGKSSLTAVGALASVLALLGMQTRATEEHLGAVTTPNGRPAASLYRKHCSSCHGRDGRSKTLKAKFNKARNLTEQGWQDAVSDERIFNSIANGRGGKMPAFAKKISEAEIDSLVLFVRGLRSS